jgi:hypothetical protein
MPVRAVCCSTAAGCAEVQSKRFPFGASLTEGKSGFASASPVGGIDQRWFIAPVHGSARIVITC